ncbi:exodeoxyribonuclease V subunit gamma [Candidatus Pantoea edessiphila]|uniref:RecBCD enzyme subunit RecC n=1 Tax=Candidatus Pantoea edessiphila TaxID=2044610 RepID=A0A2P5T1M3_9GAMM|nr:exodeoxyribonuclease V subunit gamma [Candidatus Pantoea edessiphila]PPI88452.1 exodeoxyribonuclease V subunit gamma [Candidatus Pantoea edessiphila]
MFYVYHSNQLDVLRTLLNETIKSNPIKNPFKSEVMLIQNLYMARWLRKEIALNFDIAANIKFIIFTEFIWSIISTVIPDIPVKKFFNKNDVIWMIICRMPFLLKKNEFSFITDYLDGCKNETNLFQFSLRISSIFEKYLIYRPNWLNIWECSKFVSKLGDEQLWQSAIWRDLISNYTKKSKRSLYQSDNFYSLCIKKIKNTKNTLQFLPQRLFIFDVSAFSPYHMQILNTISDFIDIHCFFKNPCCNYWGDIQNYKFLSKKSKNKQYFINKKDQNYFDDISEYLKETYEQHINNPLLVSWGKIGCDSLCFLTQLEPNNHIDAFVNIKKNNLLNYIQDDILNLKNNSIIGLNYNELRCNNKKQCIDTSDQSISINVCHNIAREIEALQDYLLKLINYDSSLKIDDIIVMASDIDVYIPFIKAIFSNTSVDRYLPFTILDRRAINEHPIIIVFLRLLSLDNNYVFEDIMAMLDIKSLSHHFSIDENQLILLQNLINNVNTYEKLNELKRISMHKYDKNYHILLNEIKVNLLKYINKNKNYSQKFLPHNITTKKLLEILLSNLTNLIFQLNKLNITLSKCYFLKDWLFIGKQLINNFFSITYESESILLLLENNWERLIQSGIKIISKKISIKLLREILYTNLSNQLLGKDFLKGKINFCNLMPTRSLPFKVICLLGMNNDKYPRRSNTIEFNLMYKQPNKGDFNNIEEDRYLFLETIISAKNTLYISYIGWSMQDSTELYPSNLITELLEYIEQNFYLKGDENIEIDKNNKNIQKHLMIYHTRAPFAPNNFKYNSKTQSFAYEWLPSARGTGIPQSSFIKAIDVPKIRILNIKELLYFWRHPIRAWFNKRLGVHFYIKEHVLSKNKSYLCNNLKYYEIKSQLLNALVENNINAIQQLYIHNKTVGNLPPGVFSELFWQSQQETMQQIVSKISCSDIKKSRNLEINLKINNLTLIGSLNQIQEYGLLRGYPDVLTIRDGLTFWLEHVVYCAMGGSGISQIFGLDKSYWYFDNISQTKAIEFLNRYIAGYHYGMSQPIPLLNKSANAWLKYCYDKKENQLITDKNVQAKAYNRLLTAWNGKYKISNGENIDPYMKRLYRTLGDIEIEQIIESTKSWYLPVLQAQKDI